MNKIKNLIQFGFYSKKLLLPFGVALFQILINITDVLFDEPLKNNFLESDLNALSEMLMPLISLFHIISSQKKKDDIPRRSWVKNFLHFFALYIIFSIFLGLSFYKNVQANIYIQKQIQNKSLQNPHNSGLSSFESLELIFICIVSIVLLKYKYFIHHIISIIIFVLTSFFIDLIVDNFSDLFDRGILFIILSIVIVAIDALDYGYQKYMIDIYFHSIWNIGLTIGLSLFSLFGSLTAICLIKGKQKILEEQNPIFMAFYRYFEQVDTGVIVSKNILNFILNFFMNMCRALTLLHFSPDFILISFTLSRMLDIILETKKFICVIFFVLQFLTLMFYLELFEFNFCGLNKNTRRNISERQIQEMLLNSDESGRPSNASEIEITPDYLITVKEKNSTFNSLKLNEEPYQMIYEMKETFEKE